MTEESNEPYDTLDKILSAALFALPWIAAVGMTFTAAIILWAVKQ